MLEKTKTVIHAILPLRWRRFLGSFFYGYFGPLASWQEAQKTSSGYDSDLILKKVASATLEVKSGRAVYERDSVLFDHIELSWPLLAGLLFIASQNGNRLDLIDFGGSLGSSYWQNRCWLSPLEHLRWNIVEQANFAAYGRQHLSDDHLRFYDNLPAALSETEAQVVLFSSSLQYVENPYEILKQAMDQKIPYLILDRTAFSEGESDIIARQKVPPQIYRASYPCWFFSESKLLSFIGTSYELLADFDTLGGTYRRHGIKGKFKGFIFKLKD